VIFIDWLGGILAGVLAWILSITSSLIVSIIDSILNLALSLINAGTILCIEMFNNNSIEWLTYPVIINFFGMCKSIGTALCVAGVIYSILENLMNYNKGKGLESFQSTFLSIVKAIIAVQLFTVVPPLLYKWSIELTKLLTKIDLMDVLGNNMTIDYSIDMSDPKWLPFFPNFLMDIEILLKLLGTVFRVINTLFVAWGIYRLIISMMRRLGTIMILTARMSLTFFSVARGMSDGFFRAVLDSLGVNVIMFLQMYLLVTAVSYNDKNPLMVWGLIIVSTQVDSILQFGVDTGSRMRTNPMVLFYSGKMIFPMLKKIFNKNKKGTISGSVLS
jgi:hypothetical protein